MDYRNIWLRVRTKVLAAVLITSAMATAYTLHKFDDATKAVTTSESIIGGLNRLELALVDAETGQRGYIITNNEGYLRPYNYGVEQVQAEITNLFVTARDDPTVLQELRSINTVATSKLVELAATLNKRHISFEAAQAEVNTHLGMNIMAVFRTKVGELLVLEQKHVVEYQAAAQHMAIWAMMSLILTLTFAFAVMAIMCKSDKIAYEEDDE